MKIKCSVFSVSCCGSSACCVVSQDFTGLVLLRLESRDMGQQAEYGIEHKSTFCVPVRTSLLLPSLG